MTRKDCLQWQPDDSVVPLIGIGRNPRQYDALDDSADRRILWHDQHARTLVPSGHEIAEIPWHGVLIVRDQNPPLFGGPQQNLGVWDAVQMGGAGTLKIDGGFATHDAGADGASEVVVSLEPWLHLFGVAGTELFASGL